MSPQPDLTIVIVNWNTRQLLLDCLASLAASTRGVIAETIVVDNASADDSVAAVRAHFPDVRLIVNTENKGFAAANNQAIRTTTSRYVLLLNSDTIAKPLALARLVPFLDRHDEVGVVGPRLLNGDGSLQPSWALFPRLWTELVGRKLRLRRPLRTRDGSQASVTDWIDGACMCVRREVLEQVGLLDESYFMYSEEVDWCYRIRKAGWQIGYYPAAEVIHFGGQSSKRAATRMKAELYLSKLRFFGKHYGRTTAVAFGLGLQAIFLAKATIGGAILLATAGRNSVGYEFARDGGLLLTTIRRHTWRQPVAERIW